jgi:hypothetical protein
MAGVALIHLWGRAEKKEDVLVADEVLSLASGERVTDVPG